MAKKLFIILGNQLFPVKNLKSFKNDHTFLKIMVLFTKNK